MAMSCKGRVKCIFQTSIYQSLLACSGPGPNNETLVSRCGELGFHQAAAAGLANQLSRIEPQKYTLYPVTGLSGSGSVNFHRISQHKPRGCCCSLANEILGLNPDYTQIPSVQKVVTRFFIVSYYIKWVTTSWTMG